MKALNMFSSKQFTDKIDQMIVDGLFEEAAEEINELLGKTSHSAIVQLIPQLRRLADHSPLAAFNLGHVLGDANPESKREATKWLEKAATSDDGIAGAACLSLAMMNLYQPVGIEYARRAAEAGFPEGMELYTVMLSRQGKVKGRALADAVGTLKKAAKDHEHGESKILLALWLIEKRFTDQELDAKQLLTEAADDGSLEAFRYLQKFFPEEPKEFAEEDEEIETLAILSEQVIPENMKRPRLIREALIKGLGIPSSDAEIITSAFFGFTSWERLSSACSNKKREAGRFDEDISALEYNERQKELGLVVMHYVDLPPFAADIAISMLAPTSNAGSKPTLKGFQENCDGSLFKVSSNDKGAAASNGPMSVSGETANRLKSPARPDVWLEAMANYLGWKFTDLNDEDGSEAALVAKTTTADGQEFDVHMSRVKFTPGDLGDEYVESLMRDIAKKSARAVLLFNKPTVSFLNKERSSCLFYGGKVWDGSAWRDFMLRPEGGIDDAIKQGLSIGRQTTKELFDDYGFPGGEGLAEAIAEHTNSRPNRMERMVAIGEPRMWSWFTSVDLALQMIEHASRSSEQG